MSKIEKVLMSMQKARDWVVKEVQKNVWLAWLHLQWIIQDETPISLWRKWTTWWTLQNSIITEPTFARWKKFVSEIWTNIEYAKYVEYWIAWKKFNYHKWSKVFKTAEWASMFRGSIEKEQDNIKHIIKYWW